MASRVPNAATPFSAFAMPTMKPTTAPVVRPEAKCWQTAACRVFLEKTGRAHWKNWKLSNGGENAIAIPTLPRASTFPRVRVRGTLLRIVRRFFCLNESREPGCYKGVLDCDPCV